MRSKYKIFHIKKLYIFFIILSLNIFFFSTIKLNAKAFEVKNIEISEPFKINFDKNEIIDAGFKNIHRSSKMNIKTSDFGREILPFLPLFKSNMVL